MEHELGLEPFVVVILMVMMLMLTMMMMPMLMLILTMVLMARQCLFHNERLITRKIFKQEVWPSTQEHGPTPH